MVNRILKEDPELAYSVSATTRKPRQGEVDGRDYRFLSREEFKRRIAAGEFAEYAESFGNLYGTPAGPLREALESGHVILLDIDVQGARQIRRKFPESVLIFIQPPDLETLAERLRKRHSETDREFDARLRRVQAELDCAAEYDHVVVNDALDAAVNELHNLIELTKEKRRGERS
jgi:guanylate kinase